PTAPAVAARSTSRLVNRSLKAASPEWPAAPTRRGCVAPRAGPQDRPGTIRLAATMPKPAADRFVKPGADGRAWIPRAAGREGLRGYRTSTDLPTSDAILRGCNRLHDNNHDTDCKPSRPRGAACPGPADGAAPQHARAAIAGSRGHAGRRVRPDPP